MAVLEIYLEIFTNFFEILYPPLGLGDIRGFFIRYEGLGKYFPNNFVTF